MARQSTEVTEMLRGRRGF